jgi:hypothetical protein
MTLRIEKGLRRYNQEEHGDEHKRGFGETGYEQLHT